jgi:hypothetical protein
MKAKPNVNALGISTSLFRSALPLGYSNLIQS